jgi:hypothetical protein
MSVLVNHIFNLNAPLPQTVGQWSHQQHPKRRDLDQIRLREPTKAINKFKLVPTTNCMLEYEELTAKKMPDSCNMRATQICMVPINLVISQNKK